jgi:hypothetical protein
MSNKKYYSQIFDARENAICLSLYNLGTMGVPMRVHFIHRKVLLQKGRHLLPAPASLFM